MDKIKAYLFLISITLVWVSSAFFKFDVPFTDFTIWGWHLYLIATVFRFSKQPKLERWGTSFWMWTDQGVNVIHCGNEDVTVSSKVGYRKLNGSKTALVMAAVIDFWWYVVTGQKNHCVGAIEHDEEHYK